MDISLNKTGKFDLDENDMPFEIDGISEILQKIYICLSAHYGEYIYDRELGSEFYMIDHNADNAEKLVEAKTRQALKAVPEAELKRVFVSGKRVVVVVDLYGEEYDIELREE